MLCCQICKYRCCIHYLHLCFHVLRLLRFVPLILYMLFFNVYKCNLIFSINSLYVVLCAVQTGGPGIPEQKKVEAQLQSKVFCLSTYLTF